jgi:cholesterol oxidase
MSTRHNFDIIIIGSGFGGSVSALRLTQKGYKVAVIEKGKRFLPTDYAKSNWNLRKYFFIPKLGFYGIQCLTLLKHVFILHGAGVGGGSLVYANNLLVPPDSVFANEGWGSGNWKEKLSPHYKMAQTMLGATPSASVDKSDLLLKEVGIELRGFDTFHINDVGIYYGETVADPYFNGEGPERTGCTYCGACMVGCRDGGKNTLDKNYLYLAEKLGATIIPEEEVVDLLYNKESVEITSKRTTGIFSPKRKFSASKIIFSGGVLGTVPLLSKLKKRGRLPNLSEHLGNFVRTNSEALLAVHDPHKDANYSKQIAITSGIYPDDDTHIEIVRYPEGSDVMALLSTLLVGGNKNIPRPFLFLLEILKHPVRFVRQLWPLNWAQKTPILLVMQTVDNYLRLNYKRRWWRLGLPSLNSEMGPNQKKIPSFIPVANEVAERLAKKMDGHAASVLPEVLFDVSSTAHILGGCIIGENNNNSVINERGQIHSYPNLYIVDGSIVPVNLGVNPSLTITALAEYIMSQFPPSKEIE